MKGAKWFLKNVCLKKYFYFLLQTYVGILKDDVKGQDHCQVSNIFLLLQCRGTV